MPPPAIEAVGHGIAPLVTGVGSLPHRERLAGWRDALRYMPHLFAIPQFPHVEQFDQTTLQPFARLPAGVRYRAGLIQSDVPSREAWLKLLERPLQLEILPGFVTAMRCLELLDKLESRELRPNRLKFQWVGPITLASCLEIGGQSALCDREMFNAVASYLTQQLEQLADWCRHCGVRYLVLDEPCLPRVEQLSNEQKQEALGALARCLTAISGKQLVVGLHCCDLLSEDLLAWLGTNKVNLSVDVTDKPQYLSRVIKLYHSLLEKRDVTLFLGVVAIDAIQTFPLSELREIAWRYREGVIFTPACGLAGVMPSRAADVFQQLHALSADLTWCNAWQ